MKRRILVPLAIGGILLSAAAIGFWRPELAGKLLSMLPVTTAERGASAVLTASEREGEPPLPTEAAQAREAIRRAEGQVPMPGTRAESVGASVGRPAREERPAQLESPRRPLGEIYASMRPQEAASVLSRLEPKFAAQILKEMAPRKAARVLAAIEPDRAAALTNEIRKTGKEPTP